MLVVVLLHQRGDARHEVTPVRCLAPLQQLPCPLNTVLPLRLTHLILLRGRIRSRVRTGVRLRVRGLGLG